MQKRLFKIYFNILFYILILKHKKLSAWYYNTIKICGFYILNTINL